MIRFLKEYRWNSYIVGVLLGLLSWITFMFMGKALGVSTTFVRIVGACEALFAGAHVSGNPYFAKYLVGKPAFEWQAALVVFLFVGAFIARKLSDNKLEVSDVPTVWKNKFGESKAKRFTFAFIGGALVAFGARMAGGCTSGHAISGGLQLAVSGWIFMIVLFAVGIPVAKIIYTRR